MMRRAFAANLLGAVLLALLFGCSAVSKTPSVPPKHPEDLPAGRVNCLECHENVSTGALKPYGAFCQTCHAGKEELKPNVKMGDRPDRMAPHRGDYLVAHRIDGRLDPGSCFRCHGNKNDVKCKQCHK